MKRAPLRCSSCGGLNVRVIDVEPDNDGIGTGSARLATVWRVRFCDDCHAKQATAEVRVDMREARRAITRLTGERRLFA